MGTPGGRACHIFCVSCYGWMLLTLQTEMNGSAAGIASRARVDGIAFLRPGQGTWATRVEWRWGHWWLLGCAAQLASYDSPVLSGNFSIL